jgi:hypothetical protein
LIAESPYPNRRKSAQSVDSSPVEVRIHPPITPISADFGKGLIAQASYPNRWKSA